METYYKITLVKDFTGIEMVQVESETPCTVTINGDRKHRISTYNCYYSDLETAKRELQNHFSRETAQAEFNILENEKLLKRFKKYLLEAEFNIRENEKLLKRFKKCLLEVENYQT